MKNSTKTRWNGRPAITSWRINSHRMKAPTTTRIIFYWTCWICCAIVRVGRTSISCNAKRDIFIYLLAPSPLLRRIHTSASDVFIHIYQRNSQSNKNENENLLNSYYHHIRSSSVRAITTGHRRWSATMRRWTATRDWIHSMQKAIVLRFEAIHFGAPLRSHRGCRPHCGGGNGSAGGLWYSVSKRIKLGSAPKWMTGKA